ncbi:unnamed protein product [Spirodela intermedia]|uniref:Protein DETOXIFICATION n=1 Tax=Spirodela intermedia TaxID=51605 RepID=A0A7I8JH16_SPIIN|nr:unnamed protein product [Spirodela intermedia]CAA6668702.1 unnamed protein product [Spirodela intermedia]
MLSTAPLLEGRDGGGAWERWRMSEAVEEAKHQVVFSVPMILTNVAYYCIPLVSVMFAGHLGNLELAGSNLANSWATVTGFTLVIGLSGALETLCGQAYGAKLYRTMGIYLQASMITVIAVSCVLAVVWWFSESILIALRQEPAVAHAAAVYMRPLIPALFAYGLLQCLLRFLQTQSAVAPLVVCSVGSLALHVLITYVLVHPAGMGFVGAPLAAAVSLWISILMLASYVKYSKRFSETWQGFSTEAFEHVLPSMRLAIPSAVMVCLEYWAFELLVLLAGLMPHSELSTSLIAICVNTEAVSFNVTYGFSAAVSTRVANELGAGNVDKAKNAVRVTLKLSVILALTIVVFFVCLHDPLLSISILLDSAQGILSGVARGCGWQHLAAWTNLAAFYLIGMPIALLLGFTLKFYDKDNRHLHWTSHAGTLDGLICGLFCQACTLLIITLRTNWSTIDLSVHKEQPLLV